jgi:signal peptidase II
VIEGFFNLVHIQNPGIIFGIFSQSTYAWTNYFLIGGSLLAIFLLLFFIRLLREGDFFLSIAISLILGGATGNLVDRIILKKVVDFLDFHWNTYHWPAFNMADSAITVGMMVLVIQILKDENDHSADFRNK